MKRSHLVVGIVISLFMVLCIVGGTLPMMADDSTSCTVNNPYSICTDKEDYHPEETVHITGTGFAAGDSLTIKVIRPDGSMVTGDGSFAPWPTAYDTVVVSSDGIFQYDYVLDGIQGKYLIQALDADGTVLASHAFTDARTINSVTLTYGGTTVPPAASITVPPGATISAAVTVTTSGGDNNWQSTSWRINTTPPGSTTCVDTPNHNNSGTYTETFNITAPAAPGTYNAYFIVYSNNTCSNGASSTYTMTGTVIVGTTAPSVTTNAATVIAATSATLNGNITSTGGVNCDYRGFVWGTTSVLANPGNVDPASAGYESNWTETGSYSTGAFNHPISSLVENTPYYFRACAHNSQGWTYGDQFSFTTLAGCGNVQTQLCLLLDGTVSISTTDFNLMKNGLATAIENAAPGCFRHDGSIELTVIQIGTLGMSGTIGANVEVPPTVITAGNAASVATTVRNITKRNGYTTLACTFYMAADTLYNSPCFSTSHKQVINLVTDGLPNRCCDDPANPYNRYGCDTCDPNGCADAQLSAEAARNYAISKLGMTAGQDEIDGEFITTGPVSASDWMRDYIVWPQPGSYTIATPPPYPPAGWVQRIADGTAYTNAICAKLWQVTCINPDCTITPTPTVLCANSTGNTASVTPVTNATYAWTITNGTITGGDGTSSITYTAGASGNVTLGVTITKAAADGGCFCTGSINVPIYQAPDCTITPTPSSVCANSTGITLLKMHR